jgi:hypothetical protein
MMPEARGACGMRSRSDRRAKVRLVQQSLFGDPPPPRPKPAEREPAPPPPPPALDALLEAALLRELRSTFDWENHARFRKRLVAPVIVLSDAATRLGQWDSRTRTLALARTLVLERPWPEVVSVLLHEMAHQFVDEALGVHDEHAHGARFREVCAAAGIDGRAAGAPEPATGERAAGDRVLERIRKLLALAASANQHEAEAAMRRAHELMLRHNIEATGAPQGYESRLAATPQPRLSRVESEIAGLLSEFFFVKVIQIPVYLPREGARAQAFELSGTRPNLDMAIHVYEFLRATAARLWRDNRDDARIRSGRDRLAYQSGVIRGFREKLVLERVQLKGTGLVWIGDADLDGYYHARHPRITRRSRSVRVNGAHAAGREAGGSIVLHRPIERGPSSGPRKLLR